VRLGLVSVADKDRATLHIHSNHSIKTCKHPTPVREGGKAMLVGAPDADFLQEEIKELWKRTDGS